MPLLHKRSLTVESRTKLAEARKKLGKDAPIILSRGIRRRDMDQVIERLTNRKRKNLAKGTDSQDGYIVKSYDIIGGEKAAEHLKTTRPTAVQIARRLVNPVILRRLKRLRLTKTQLGIIEQIIKSRPLKIPGTQIDLHVPTKVLAIELINEIGVVKTNEVAKALMGTGRFFLNAATQHERTKKENSDMFLNVPQAYGELEMITEDLLSESHREKTSSKSLLEHSKEFMLKRREQIKLLDASDIEHKDVYKKVLYEQYKAATMARVKYALNHDLEYDVQIVTPKHN